MEIFSTFVQTGLESSTGPRMCVFPPLKATSHFALVDDLEYPYGYLLLSHLEYIS